MRISDWSSDVCSSDLDAYFFVGGYPTGAVSELATSSGISLVPITGSGADKLLADYGFFAKDVVPEGTYAGVGERSEEHTSELQSLMRISYAVFCLKKKKERQHIQKMLQGYIINRNTE